MSCIEENKKGKDSRTENTQYTYKMGEKGKGQVTVLLKLDKLDMRTRQSNWNHTSQ